MANSGAHHRSQSSSAQHHGHQSLLPSPQCAEGGCTESCQPPPLSSPLSAALAVHAPPHHAQEHELEGKVGVGCRGLEQLSGQ